MIVQWESSTQNPALTLEQIAGLRKDLKDTGVISVHISGQTAEKFGNLISKVGFESPASETFVGVLRNSHSSPPLCETPQILGFLELNP